MCISRDRSICSIKPHAVNPERRSVLETLLTKFPLPWTPASSLCDVYGEGVSKLMTYAHKCQQNVQLVILLDKLLIGCVCRPIGMDPGSCGELLRIILETVESNVLPLNPFFLRLKSS